MKKKSILIGAVFVILILGYSVRSGLAGQRNRVDEIVLQPSTELERFSSDREFDEYFRDFLKKKNQESRKEGSLKKPKGAPLFESAMKFAPAPAPTGAAATSDSESVTNVQVSGVDEGDIVKAARNYLVILRRGRLFAVDIENAAKSKLKPVSQIDVPPPGSTKFGWSDEMLIHDDSIFVIGYNGSWHATEITKFKISKQGNLSRVSTYFLDSDDYYSSRNFASRLIGDKLIFYMPMRLLKRDWAKKEWKIRLPGISKWEKDDKLKPKSPVISKADIFKPVQRTVNPYLHMIVECDLKSVDLKCRGKALIGPYSRSFFVSASSVYTWISPEYVYSRGRDDSAKRDSSLLVRMPLDVGDVTAVKVYGSPLDQFSFNEYPNGPLAVFVRENGYGDAMWNSEFTSGNVALVKILAGDFSNKPSVVKPSSYSVLPSPFGNVLQNRFVGDYFLYGSGGGWFGRGRKGDSTIYIVNVENVRVNKLRLSHGVGRIEPLGDGALIAGMGGKDLKLSSVDLGGARAADTFEFKEASQGETRSHGFFFKPNKGGGGVMGLPLRRRGKAFMQLFKESSSVVFLRLNGSLKFERAGELFSGRDISVEDNCKSSCVDWYGNSRPIFLRDRIFALLGYELVEGAFAGDKIKEISRTDFSPQNPEER